MNVHFGINIWVNTEIASHHLKFIIRNLLQRNLWPCICFLASNQSLRFYFCPYLHLHLLMLEAMFMQSDFQFLERTCYMCRKMTNSQRANILLWIKLPHSPAILLSTDAVCRFHKPVTKSEVFKSKITMKQPFNFKQKSCF